MIISDNAINGKSEGTTVTAQRRRPSLTSEAAEAGKIRSRKKKAMPKTEKITNGR